VFARAAHDEKLFRHSQRKQTAARGADKAAGPADAPAALLIMPERGLHVMRGRLSLSRLPAERRVGPDLRAEER
jgi:hypothetical protein